MTTIVLEHGDVGSGGSKTIDDVVAAVRVELRGAIPAALESALSACAETAVAAVRGAALAADRAVGDGASSIVCGCGVAEGELAKELGLAKEALLGEVLKAAKGHADRRRAPPSTARALEDVEAAWGGMWARLDDVCNTSLQRSVHAADRLAKWSAAALVGPCSSLDEFVREALRRMRAIWSAAALKIGGMLRDATLAFHEQFSRYEARVKAGGAQSPTAADGGGGGRPRSAQATLAALLFATGKQVMSFLCSGLERILSGLQAVSGRPRCGRGRRSLGLDRAVRRVRGRGRAQLAGDDARPSLGARRRIRGGRAASPARHRARRNPAARIAAAAARAPPRRSRP